MGCSGNKNMVGVVVALLVVMAVMTAEGQDIPSCASGLVPCADYLNATSKPPASCCDPIKEAVTKQLPCLCNLYNTPGLLKSFGINVTQASRLPPLCGVPGDLGDLCQGGKNTSSPVVPASGGKNTSSPVVPASGTPKANNSTSTPSTPKSSTFTPSNTGRLASTGIFSCILIWASLIHH